MNNKTLKMAIMSLMAALAYIAFTFLQIKIPTPGGFTSFHLGNTFCVLGALLIGGVQGGIAGAIGMGIGDMLDPAYVLVAPKTMILKFFIGVVTGYVAHHVFHILKQEGTQLKVSVFLSCLAGMVFNIIGEPLFSYFYTCYLLGAPQKAAQKLASFNLLTTSVNALLTVIIASLFYLALSPRLKRNSVLNKIGPKE